MIQTAESIATRIHNDPVFRKSVCLRHHYWFFMTYFTAYLKFPCADMHKKMLYLSEMSRTHQMIVLGFPQCGKTLIHSYSLPLWSMLNGSAKNIIIVVGNPKEKSQFCNRFEQMMMFRHELKRDFSIRYKKRGWYFLFPNLQSQIYVASLEETDQLDSVLGRIPDLIIVDPLERFQQKSLSYAERMLFILLNQVGDKETRKIIVGRGDGGDGPMMNIADRLFDQEDLQYKTVFYPFYSINGESVIPTWKGKFPNQQAIESEIEKTASAEEYFFEYCLQKEVSELPFCIPEKNYNDVYPTDLNHFSEEHGDDITGVFFAPYKGEYQQASIAWGVELSNRRYVYQGIIWEGVAENFDANQFFTNIRLQLDNTPLRPKMLFFGDKNDPFGKEVCHCKFSIQNYSSLCVSRHEQSVLKDVLTQAIGDQRIQFQSSFANDIGEMLVKSSEASERFIHQLSLPLLESSPQKIFLVVSQ